MCVYLRVWSSRVCTSGCWWSPYIPQGVSGFRTYLRVWSLCVCTSGCGPCASIPQGGVYPRCAEWCLPDAQSGAPRMRRGYPDERGLLSNPGLIGIYQRVTRSLSNLLSFLTGKSGATLRILPELSSRLSGLIILRHEPRALLTGIVATVSTRRTDGPCWRCTWESGVYPVYIPRWYTQGGG